MATSTINLKLRDSYKNMAQTTVLFFIILFIRIVRTEEDPIHMSGVLKTRTLFLEEIYSGPNHTDDAYWRSEVESSRTRPTPSPRPNFLPTLTADCLHMLQEYASLSSGFMYCALAYSKPLLFCESCVDKFIEAERKYKEIERVRLEQV